MRSSSAAGQAWTAPAGLGGFQGLPSGLNLNLAFHKFDSANGDIDYGTEWDASAGIKLGKLGLLLKFADYDAKAFAVDTRKVWLQAEWAF